MLLQPLTFPALQVDQTLQRANRPVQQVDGNHRYRRNTLRRLGVVSLNLSNDTFVLTSAEDNTIKPAQSRGRTGVQQYHTSKNIKKRVTHPVCFENSGVWKADKRVAIHYTKCWKRPEEKLKEKKCTPTVAMSEHGFYTYMSINHPAHNRNK